MKRITIITIFATILINSSNLFAAATNDILLIQSPKYKKLSFDYKIDSFFLPVSEDLIKSTDITAPNGDATFIVANYSQKLKDAISQFSLGTKDPFVFSLDIPSEIILTLKNKKDYSRAALELASLNLTIWIFNKYIMKESWANISLESISKNLKSGFAWDIDTFRTNQLGHPYHGAIHYSVARANGLNFFESTIYSTLGSYMWEVFLESIRPSKNDIIINTLGGITLGEALFKIADLVVDESSGGLERALRESFAFIINPAYGFRAFSGKAFKTGNPPEKHYYSLEFPFGVYRSSADKPTFVIEANLEYKDFLKINLSEINPYDWFTLDFRLGLSDDGFQDKEIFTTGILTGKKVKNGLAGLFGVFDYINSNIGDKMSAIGVGPGILTIFVSDSDFFFNSSGVLSLIWGGSSPSFDLENSHFGKKTNDPYFLGPGMLGRFKLELGKKDLGSIDTGFSQYWIHSIHTNTNEFLAILSLNLKCDISDKSQIKLGYDYYLRHASLQKEYFRGAKQAICALYVLKF